jgi:excisionase family DNA binding protein
MTKLLTIPEVADILRCKPGVVYDLCEQKILRHCRVGTGRGRILVSEEAVEEYVKRCEVAAGTGQPVDAEPARTEKVAFKHRRR